MGDYTEHVTGVKFEWRCVPVWRLICPKQQIMSKTFKTVILGGGNASGYAAKEWIRRSGPVNELAIITDEPYVAYERPALSKAYLFPENPARLPGFHTCVGGGGERQDPKWYQDNGIEYLTETRIKRVNIKKKTLETEAGKFFSYEKLVIATGCEAVDLAEYGTKGTNLRGIHYLRNIVDADKLIESITAAKEKGGKAVCIGGGYIGMECAAVLQQNGLDVTMVFPEARLMERLFTEELSDFYEKFYADKDITMLHGNLAVAFEGDEEGHVTHTVLKSGTKLECDLVLVGVGAHPNTDLFRDQLDLLPKAPGGIKVNGHLQTSNPDVYAIGDVAAFPLKVSGAITRQEHVTNARLSAAHVIGEILAPDTMEEYDYQPFFYSRVFNLSWQFYGLNVGDVVHFGDQSTGKFGAYWVKDGKVVGAFLESGTTDEFAAIKKLAIVQPVAPEDLKEQGIGFASKL